MCRAGPGTRVRQITRARSASSDDDLLARRVGDVRERALAGGQPSTSAPRSRRARAHAGRRRVEQRDDAMLRVGDHRQPGHARLDAPWARPGPDAPQDFVVSEVEHDDVALEIRGDESDRRAAEPCSEPSGSVASARPEQPPPRGTRACPCPSYACRGAGGPRATLVRSVAKPGPRARLLVSPAWTSGQVPS